MPNKSLADVFIDELGEMYDAETRLIHAMPKFIRSTHSPRLRDELTRHSEQARGQLARLEQVFELLGIAPRRNTCNAMEALLCESDCLLSESGQVAIRDSAILAAAQKIEHYEIATYATLREWAQQLGRADASMLLQQTFDEETTADSVLSHLALTLDNDAARARQ